MASDDAHRARELSDLLEEASFQITAARAAGLERVDDLRSAMKKAREVLADADGLAADVAVVRRRSQEED